jgi:cytochrome c oxidase assembly protein subunit 15
MAGRYWPSDYAGHGIWATIAHSQAAVQMHHRLVAYLLLAVAITFGVAAWRSTELARDAKFLALGVVAAILLQAVLGVVTLMLAVPIALGVAHQVMAALTLCLTVAFAWRARRM